jgi:hypothetical protein
MGAKLAGAPLSRKPSTGMGGATIALGAGAAAAFEYTAGIFLFEDFVGSGKECLRNCQTESRRCLDVNG